MTSQSSTSLCARWSAASRVRAEGTVRFDHASRFPSVVESKHGLLVFGNDTPNLFPQAFPVSLLSIQGLDGAIALPAAGEFSYRVPFAVAHNSGRISLLWSEADAQGNATNTLAWSVGTAATIWVAEYSEELGWSQPEQVFSGITWWNRYVVGRLAVEGDAAAIAAPAPPTALEPSAGIVALVRRGGKWSAVRIPLENGAVSASPALVDRTLVIVFIAAVSDGTSDRNSLQVVRANLDDLRFEPQKLLVRGRSEPVVAATLIAGGTSALNLVYLQAVPNGMHKLVHASLGPKDLVITRRTEHSIAGHPQNLVGVADQCGGVHVVFENVDLQSGDGSLWYAYWRGEWRIVRALVELERALDPTLHLGSDGNLRIAYSAQPRTAPAKSKYASYLSILVPD